MSGAVSTPVTLRAAVGAYLGDLVEAAAGGIQCSWSSENGAVWVDVDALPADVLTIAVDHGCGPGGELDGPICGIDATSDGIRLAGAVLVAEGDSAPALAAVQNLEEIFATRASGNGAPAPQRPSSAWGHLADCDSLVGAAAAQAGMASDVLIGETPTYDAYFVPAYLELRGGRLGCGAISVDTDASTDFAVIGGAQWAEALVAAREGTQLVAVPGLDTVYLGAEQSTGYRYIDVFDGVNWLEAFTTDPEWSYPLLAAVVAELNDRL